MTVYIHAERRVKDWLYPLPDFMSLQSPYKPIEEVEKELKQRDALNLESEPEDSRPKALEDQLRAHLASDLEISSDDTARNVLEDIINRGIKRWRGPKRYGGEKEGFSYSNWADIVVDVGQHQRDKPSTRICDADYLDLHLREARSVEHAKKRFQ